MKTNSVVEKKECVICTDIIDSEAIATERKPRVLDCSHVFHNECIGEWLNHKHDCPLCRVPVKENKPILSKPEMTTEEILSLVRSRVAEFRQIRLLNLNENTPQANTAKKVHSLAANIFGFK